MIRLVVDADDARGGLTLAELAQFVEQAKRAGCPDAFTVSARVTWRGRVRQLRVTPPAGTET